MYTAYVCTSTGNCALRERGRDRYREGGEEGRVSFFMVKLAVEKVLVVRIFYSCQKFRQADSQVVANNPLSDNGGSLGEPFACWETK